LRRSDLKNEQINCLQLTDRSRAGGTRPKYKFNKAVWIPACAGMSGHAAAHRKPLVRPILFD
jgi:hypothetical protein